MTFPQLCGHFQLSISTPMPLAGHDRFQADVQLSSVMISTPMPLAGHDDMLKDMENVEYWISTPMPLAGHDYSACSACKISDHFYSHAPRGA